MRAYELVMLVSPQIADEDVNGVVDRVSGFITARGGEIGGVKPWGRRKMAYHIDDFQEANYVQTNFTMDPEQVKDLESSLHISEDVIRHLLVREEE